MRMIYYALLTAVLLSSCAPTDLSFSVEITDNGGLNPSLPKSPVRPPQATLDGHTLTFTSSHPDYTLILINGEGEEVYAVTVSAADSVVVLPSTLSGNYVLTLAPGSSYYFYSEIEL